MPDCTVKVNRYASAGVGASAFRSGSTERLADQPALHRAEAIDQCHAGIAGTSHERVVDGKQPCQSIGRAMVGLFAPRANLAEFFGLWTFSTRLASIVGPLTYGVITWVTGGNQRLAIASTAVERNSTPSGHAPLGIEFDPSLLLETYAFVAALDYAVLFPLAGFENAVANLSPKPAQLVRLRLNYLF